MKKKLALLLVASLGVSMLLVGCGNNKDKDTDKEQIESTEGVVDVGTESTEEVVDTSVLYEKSEYESLKFEDYVKFGDYSKIITIKEADYIVTDEELQKEIDYYRNLHGETTQIKERAVAEKDKVNIDFVGKIDGKEFEGGSSKGYTLEIGSKTFIDGFEAGLVGVTPGQTVSLNLTFPEDYKNNPDLAGKPVIFDVTVNFIEGEIIPAEYTNKLVETITNGDYKTTEDFTEYIKKYVETQKKQSILTTFKAELLKVTEFTGDISKFVDAEYQHGLEYYKSYADSAGYTLEEFAVACGYKTEAELLEYIKSDSETYVKEKIMLYAYGNAVGFEMDKDAVKAGAEKIVNLYGYGSIEALLTQYNASIIRFDVFSDMIADKIIENYK